MNLELTTTNLQDLEQLITTLFAESKCACHIINPHKTRILLWKEVKNDQITYYLRIGIQKFVSQEQIDRNGETYWRFVNYTVEKETPVETKNNSPLDPVAKFQQRQAKTQELNNHAKPAINSSQQPDESVSQ
ncbi:MAG: hypothetical protein MRERV_4c088 [Mycoplasmataceae bacterium RV_VA103A]|nr:MAG: hypothetical protein MRERV_11c044 [Mycoplasmataceae bacterium RV_VA103A]KLL05179.1 MAG: hypothetical protein MRERV_4c088 [Mycoplasmataceae bacterium RV_VA103A]